MKTIKIPEGSDTEFTFHITEIDGGTATDLDLTGYDKVILSIKFINSIIEKEGLIDLDKGTSYVKFTLVSDDTAGKSGAVSFDIWGTRQDEKVRFNTETMVGQILPSIKIPGGVVNG